jgi:branched-chain amino acid transport system ATP-binding protein
MLLELKGVTFNYDQVVILEEVSLNIEQGEIVALIGANGAGKTTTLRLISGLIRPKKGEIWYEGKNSGQISPQRIVEGGIVHVPEGRRVFSTLTVEENLILGAFSRRDQKEVGKDLNEQYRLFPRLKERRKQQAGSLSGGEQQMLAFGRALMARPKLMLLDEPTMGLSPLVVAQVAEIIQEINRKGVSVLLVEQNARIALRLAGKGYVLETGRIVMEGPSLTLSNEAHVKQAYLGG